MPSAASLARRPVKPERILALGFLMAIVLGAVLLSLPVSGEAGHSIGIRAGLFTATSAVCVTGLTLIDAGTQLSSFGQAVLLILIQIGGLGFMSFATLIMVALGRRVSLSSRVVLRDSMNQTTLGGMVRLSLSFFGIAMAIETVGAMILMIRLIPLYGVGRGIWYSFFTSISAFCNAGFDLFGQFQSLTHLQQEPAVLLTLSTLIILGGLGFTVIDDCLHARFRFRALSLHSKLVLCATGILLLSGTAGMLLLESHGVLAGMNPFHKLINSFFQSVTLRTAGFASVDQSAMTDTAKLFGCMFMFIGASPASTGGGIKTVTAVTLILLVNSVIRNQKRIHVFGRELAQDTARRSMAIAFIGMTVVFLAAGVISTIEQARGVAMIDVLFEAVSAFSTTGLSSANTPSLCAASQWLLMPLMYLGRVGPLTLVFALASRTEANAASRVGYPEEKIMIG